MELMDKLTILSDAAKYDAACTSSGVGRNAKKGSMGSTSLCGICHSFSADGRCISLLKVLMTNSCIYDCKYCINRVSNDTPRATFSPQELAQLTMGFYRRNYIEGLFLSSGIIRNPDYTCERMIETLHLLREEYHFSGYIHAKAIPGADETLITRLGLLADRLSINIELPSQKSLKLLAPNKTKEHILKPMTVIRNKIEENTHALTHYRSAPKFSPAGQSTQMIIGATPDNDRKIITLTEALYKQYRLKRVFFSAYMPVASNPLLPALDTTPPLLREHRLYQADWLLRFYGFSASELLDDQNPNFNLYIDPKSSWALAHLDTFPLEINSAPYEMLLRVPGIGIRSARRIIEARRMGSLDFDGIRRMGVVMKRAQYFITCRGKMISSLRIDPVNVMRALMSQRQSDLLYTGFSGEQLSLFFNQPTHEEVLSCLTGQI